MRWPAVLLVWLSIACSPTAPPAEPRPTSSALPVASPVPASPAPSAPAPSASAADLGDPLPEAVATAYRSPSTDAFRPIVDRLLRQGARWSSGLGDRRGVVVEGAYMAALRDGALTYFFDKTTGEIAHVAAHLSLYPSPPLIAPYFLSEIGTLYDPTTGGHRDPPGKAIAVHPDGRRLYVARDDCSVLEWSLATQSILRALPAQTQSRCTSPGFPHGEVAAKSDLLVSPWGMWNLTTGRIIPAPFLTGSVVDPAVSPGARYVARLIENPRATNLTDKYLLQLYELATATVTTASSPVGVQSNSASLAFLDDPLRLCITNYGREVFLVPSLEHLAPAALAPDPHDPRPTCNLAAHTPKADHPELRQRIAAQVCALGDVLLPRAVCDAG